MRTAYPPYITSPRPTISQVDNMRDWSFFMHFQLQQLEQMLDNALNHAAVFAWGWFNEGVNTPWWCENDLVI